MLTLKTIFPIFLRLISGFFSKNTVVSMTRAQKQAITGNPIKGYQNNEVLL